MIEIAVGFQRFAEDDWRRVVGAELPVFRSEDGIAVGALYGPGTGAVMARDNDGRAWNIVATVAAAAVSDAAEQIRAEVDGGATGIELLFASSPSARGRGLPSATIDWKKLFAGISLGELSLRVDGGEETFALAGGLLPFLKSAAPRELTFVFDPIALLAARGWLAAPFAEIGAKAAGLAAALAENGLSGHVLVADGRVWHNAGATEVEELASAIAAFAEYLRLLEADGISAERAVGLIGITLAADADQFMTIAKLRAMRLLHARLLEAAELAPRPCSIHAETSWRMQSRLDPHSNILRTTAAVAAAGMGGADSVAALPFDAAIVTDDPFPRRVARNSQTILIEEAGLARVADPGAGSGAIEALTSALAEAAWERFRQIESEGGLLAAVLSASVQRTVEASRQNRIDRLRRNEIQIIGANAFPDPAAKVAPSGQVTRPNAKPAGTPALAAEALGFVRLTESIET
ncbi:MAG: methylmalonyl-CoA mutase family protein [Bauldia sp.]